MKKYIVIPIISVSIFMQTACKKFVSINPPIDKIVAKEVYTSDEMATNALRGIYVTLATSVSFAGGQSSVTMLAGRSADEFTNFYNDDAIKQFSENSLISTNGRLQSGLWTSPYKIIYATNSFMENVSHSMDVTVAVKKQLLAEAKFIRSLSYFYLTNLFGDVPLLLTSDYRQNAIAFSNTQLEIYSQIVKDLEEATADLSDNYPGADRTRANKWAAMALLSRTYLYIKNYEKAESYASAIIANTTRYKLITDDLNKVFLKNSDEAILQLYVPAANNVNTYEGLLFILNAAPGNATEVVISSTLYNSFEDGDLRKSKWVGTFSSGANTWYYPSKYKVKSGSNPSLEYSMVLRIGEQYLIRAEARINQETQVKIDQGISDLNILRQRSRQTATAAVPNPLPALTNGLSKADALLAVEKERRNELFSEWGHRWLDLKRTKRVDAVLSIAKGSNWQTTDQLYPIPNSDILNNPNLKQNDGYN